MDPTPPPKRPRPGPPPPSGTALWQAAWQDQKIKPFQEAHDGKSASFYPKTFIDLPNFNFNILIRKEYPESARELERQGLALSGIEAERRFIVTGQPGIGECKGIQGHRAPLKSRLALGKTVFLIYLLIERLSRKQPTAVQLYDPRRYPLFDEEGVRELSSDDASPLSPEVWALTDSNDEVIKPCTAFTKSDALVLLASSPRSPRWKEWKKQNYARLFVMDLWSESELHMLLLV